MPSVRSSLRLFALVATAVVAGSHLRAQMPGPELTPGSGAAKLVQFTGQISVMRDTSLWALNLGDLVQPQQVIVTGTDGYGLFKVADGSTFEVFPKSRVVFRQTSGDWRDLLEVWLGKVRVKIEHPGGLPNNNKVRTPSAVISVRGTVFDVEVEDEDATTLVLDEEGSVEVAHTLKAGTPRTLVAGEWIRVYKNDPLAKKMIDKGALLQRAFRAASDALYQVAVNGRTPGSTGTGTGTIATTPSATTSGAPADTKNGNPAPTAQPPAPAPPPPAPGAH